MSIANFFVRGNDPTNKEIGRLIWAATAICGLVFSGYDLFGNGNFDIKTFGEGMLYIMLGGVGVAAKDFANRSQPDTTTSTVTTVEKPE